MAVAVEACQSGEFHGSVESGRDGAAVVTWTWTWTINDADNGAPREVMSGTCTHRCM